MLDVGYDIFFTNVYNPHNDDSSTFSNLFRCITSCKMDESYDQKHSDSSNSIETFEIKSLQITQKTTTIESN